MSKTTHIYHYITLMLILIEKKNLVWDKRPALGLDKTNQPIEFYIHENEAYYRGTFL